MKTIEIKNITEETFEHLNTKVPILPAGVGHYECKNPYMLTLWRDRFFRFYGIEGVLYLDWQPGNQVEGNEKFDEACMSTCNHIETYQPLD